MSEEMKKEFIPYELALRMKQLGFDEPCLAYYSILEIQRIGEHNLHYTQRGKEILRENDWSWVYRNFPKFRKYLKAEHCYKYSTNSSKLIASAPTYSQCFRWFREKYDLHVEIARDKENSKLYVFFITNSDDIYPVSMDFSDGRLYEEAELECLKKLIEIVKQK
jgi:hypothetical protein